MNPAIAVLVKHGFGVEILDDVDPYGPTVFIRARIASELDGRCVLDWVQSIVEPLGGDVMEAGFAQPPQAA